MDIWVPGCVAAGGRKFMPFNPHVDGGNHERHHIGDILGYHGWPRPLFTGSGCCGSQGPGRRPQPGASRSFAVGIRGIVAATGIAKRGTNRARKARCSGIKPGLERLDQRPGHRRIGWVSPKNSTRGACSFDNSFGAVMGVIPSAALDQGSRDIHNPRP